MAKKVIYTLAGIVSLSLLIGRGFISPLALFFTLDSFEILSGIIFVVSLWCLTVFFFYSAINSERINAWSNGAVCVFGGFLIGSIILVPYMSNASVEMGLGWVPVAAALLGIVSLKAKKK